MATFAKLGGHLRLWDNAGQCWATQTPTVKSLDVPAYLDLAGGKLSVFRHYFGSQDVNGGGASAADTVISALQGRHPSYIEGFNEVAQTLSSGLAQYVVWTRQFVDEAHAHGYKVAGFSWSTGNPGPADWAYCRSQGWAGVDAIAMHAYWGNQGFTVYNALRFSQLWQPGDPPVIVSECGRDAVEGGAAGWMASGLTAQQYISELESYDQHLQQYSYVLGAHVYTNGGCPDFCNFEIDPLATVLWGSTCTPPPPPPPPGGCQNDSQCSFGYHCIGGKCVCTATADCQAAFGPNTACINGACVQTAGGCQSPADCQYLGPSYTCIGGQCVSVQPPPPGINPVLLVAGLIAGVAIGGALYYVATQGGATQVIGAADVRTIPADQPVPPGYIVIG